MRGIKIIIIIRIFLFLLPVNTYSQSAVNLIPWSDVERLKPSDFRLSAPTRRTERNLGHGRKSILEGFIYSGIEFNFQHSNRLISYSVKSFMNQDKSWLRDSSDEETLKHEQAHFDITEIYSRKLKKALSTVRNTDDAKKLYQQYFRDLQEEQNSFDEAHHSETGVEPEWQKKINNQLKDLEKWAVDSLELNSR